MDISLSKDTIEIIKKVGQTTLPKDFELFVFGSRVHGTNREFSDIDLGIKSKSGTDPLDFDSYLRLKSKLDDTNIPYRIELVDFDRANEEFEKEAYKHRYVIL